MTASESAVSPADTQEEVLAFLAAPETHNGQVTERCDTHAAVVILAGRRAYKIKRAVRFPFLDYSSLDKRRIACAAELDVNRRFAPALYHRIVPITRERNGELALDGAGTPVEWAVEMERFDERQTLDHVADTNQLNDDLAARLATTVAAMHEQAAPADAAAWLDAIDSYIGQNTRAFLDRESVFPRDRIAPLEQAAREAFKRLLPLLLERGKLGLVRRGHGDLHLGNLALIDGAPVAFDAIEFDPVVASGDLLYDLAFLLMDLVERDLPGAANIVLNGYFAASRRDADDDGLAALPLFMSLRAAIRAKVTAARLDRAVPADHAEIIASARRYFDLACTLLRPSVPAIVCTAGMSGTGKSVLARSLAPFLPPAPGALILRSDVERKNMFSRGETERLPGEAYDPQVSRDLYASLRHRAERIARAGYSVIVDAVFAREDDRTRIEAVAARAGATFCGLYLTADLPTRLSRIAHRGPDASDADAAIARAQEEAGFGPMTWIEVDASGTPDQTLARARVICGERAPAQQASEYLRV